MRGVKYSLSIEIPNEEKLIVNDVSMENVCDIIKKTFKDKYYIDIKCNNQIIYNLINRPKTASSILKSKVLIHKV
jgi:hypothetical protein